MDFGISTHLFHAERLGPAHLDAVAAAGFARVELFATQSHFDYTDPSQARDLAAWTRQAGLRLHSVHAPIAEFLHGTTWGPPISTGASSAAARSRAIDACRQALEIAAAVPFEFLVLHLGVPEAYAAAGDNHRDSALRSVEALRAAADGTGVRLALEVIPNGLSTASALVRLIEEHDLHDVGICLDVGHAQLQGDVSEAIETAGGYLLTTHVHDNGGRSDDHLLPFDGVIDWPATLMAFQKVGYGGTLLFELAAGPQGAQATLEGAAAARRHLEHILGDELTF